MKQFVFTLAVAAGCGGVPPATVQLSNTAPTARTGAARYTIGTHSQHPEWKIGEPFTGDRHLTHCECWGDHPMCFREGDHVALGFARSCNGLDSPAGRRALAGVIIRRAVWRPIPYEKREDEDVGGTLGDALGE